MEFVIGLLVLVGLILMLRRAVGRKDANSSP